MIVITDSNIIFSALISPNSAIGKIFKSKKKVQFFAPDFIFLEFTNHLSKICEITGLSKKQILENYKNLLLKIEIIESNNIPKSVRLKADKLVSSIDIDDALFVALHFQTKHKIWTGDKKLIDGLKAQGYDICVTTTELKKKLKI